MALKKYCTFLLFLTFSFILLAQTPQIDSSPTPPDSLPGKILHLAEPEYPDFLAEKKTKGTVLFFITVQPDSSFEILNIEGPKILESYANEALYQSKFQPAFVKNIPVKTNMQISFSFPPANYKEKLKKMKEIDPDSLKKQIIQSIQDQNNKEKDEFTLLPNYSFDYHIKGLLSDQPFVIKQGFLDRNYEIENSLVYQNYMPLYQITKQNQVLSLQLPDYNLRPLLTYSHMGIGAQELKFANLTVQKAHLLNIENLDFYTGYFAQDGFSLQTQEKSANSILSLKYQMDDLFFKTEFMGLNQDFTTNRMKLISFPTSDYDIVSQQLNEICFTTGFKIFNISYLNKSNSYSSLTDHHYEMKENSFSAGINTRLFNQKISYQAQLMQEKAVNDTMKVDENGIWHLLNLETQYKKLRLTHHSFIKNINDLYHQSTMSIDLLNHLSLIGSYQGYERPKSYYILKEDQYFVSKTMFGLSTSYPLLDMDLMIGTGDKHQEIFINQTVIRKSEDLNLMSALIKSSFSYKDYILTVILLNEYNSSEILYNCAKLNGKYDFNLVRPLKHDNKIFAGLTAYYHSSVYFLNGLKDGNTVVDTYLGCNITKLFEFRVDFKNILNTEKYYESSLNPYYIGASVKWNFIN